MIWLAAASLTVWLYLALLHGRFWQAGPVLPLRAPIQAPPVVVIVPARDEAKTVAACLRSLLAQDYAGQFRVVLVEDESTDGTGDIARGIGDPRLSVIAGEMRPPGWSGKLWAVAQGLDYCVATSAKPDALILLTDADIVHDPAHLTVLVAHAEYERLDMVSEMVALRCVTIWERALIPAFVYFFQLLYPFARVNDPQYLNCAAAAGGTVLIRRNMLSRIGGIEAIRGALIDDVALASRTKTQGRIWLGHAGLARSLRAYGGPAEIWRVIARTAYVQLWRSPLLLAGTVLGLLLIWVVPPWAALFTHGLARRLGWSGWIIAALTYLPTLGRMKRSWIWAPVLPLIAIFYLAATLGSAFNHHFRFGNAWKGRAYGAPETP